MPGLDYMFEPVTRADLPLLRSWLAAPHVAAVWGDPDEETALIESEIDGGDCRMHIVHLDSPIGYIQNWDAGCEDHFQKFPAGTRAMDTLLGERCFLGRGHAKAYVRKYARSLIDSGVPLVVADPRISNPRGIAMYLGAGFHTDSRGRCETGEEVQILTYPNNTC